MGDLSYLFYLRYRACGKGNFLLGLMRPMGRAMKFPRTNSRIDSVDALRALNPWAVVDGNSTPFDGGAAARDKKRIEARRAAAAARFAAGELAWNEWAVKMLVLKSQIGGRAASRTVA